MNRYRNLLFGLAAAQAGKVPAERLGMLAQESQQQGSTDLGERLVAEGLISTQECATFNELVDREIAAHAGNMEAAVATLWQTLRTTPPAASAASGEELPPWSESIFSQPSATIPADSPFNTDDAVSAPSPQLSRASMHSAIGFPSALEAIREQSGRYREIRTVARGGMGRILLVHDASLCRDVAMKQLLPGTEDPELVSRFLREARVTGQLEHPSIVPVYELGYRTDGSLFYTMRLVRGHSLEEEIGKRPALADRLNLLPHLLDLCQAIAYAHSRGVVHRDIKPLNVMIGEFGETVLIDWGIAKLRGMHDTRAGELREAMDLMRNAPDDATLKTTYGQTLGSPYYMPPEQAAGDVNAVDERSDIYALGAVLYAVLAGVPPYHGLTTRDFLDRVGAFPPRPVRELCPKAPPELAAICIRAMAREPEKRYTSARELAEELRRYFSGGLVNAYDYHMSELAKRYIRKHRAVLTTAALAVLALVGLAGWSYGRVSRERDFAREQQIRAENERGRAEQARTQAEDARTQAEKERTRAERELYFANIALAQRAADESRMDQARQLLESAPPQYRSWEWAWLVRSINEDLQTIKEGGRYVAFADGGKRLITVRDNGQIVLSDAFEGTPLQTLCEKGGYGLAIASDGAGARIAASTAKTVYVWETASGRELFHFDEPEDSLSRNFIAISQDGRRIAALNTDKTLRVWEIGNTTPIFEYPIAIHQGFGIWLNTGGSRLLVAGTELTEQGMRRQLEWIDPDQRKSINKVLLPDMQNAYAAVFSPDGALTAAALDEQVEIWDTADGKLIRTIQGKFSLPDTITFDPSSQWLAMGGADGQVTLWDRVTNQEFRSTDGHKDGIRVIAFQPGGALLASAGIDRTIRLWHTPDLSPAALLRGHNRTIFSMAFSPDGARLATGAFDGTTRLWDMTREALLATPRTIAGHPASGKIAAGYDGLIAIIDGRTGRRIKTLEIPGFRVETLAFDNAGNRIIAALNRLQDPTQPTAAPEYRITAWQWVENKKILDLPAEKAVDMLAFTGPEDNTAVVRMGSEVKLIECATATAVLNISDVVDIALSADGKELALCHLDDKQGQPDQQSITRYNTETRERITDTMVPTGFTSGLCYAPNGQWLALGALLLKEDDWIGGVYLWKLPENGSPQWLQSYPAMVSSVAFSADSAWLAAGGKNGGISLWNTDSGTERWKIQGHNGNIAAIAFSPEGKRMLTAGADGHFKLWDADDGREIVTMDSFCSAAADNATPTRAAFSREGAWILTQTGPNILAPMICPVFPMDKLPDQTTTDGLWENIETWKKDTFSAPGDINKPVTETASAPGP